MKKKRTAQSAFFNLRVLVAFLLCGAAACSLLGGALLAFFHPEAPVNVSQRTLTFAQRVGYQRGIEEVYWQHRIWPKERPGPKPSFDAVMSQAQLEKKVADYLRKSQELQDYWGHVITDHQLQAEMDRMAQDTKQPKVLRELFVALGNDPFIIAECLARPMLIERLAGGLSPNDKGERFALLRKGAGNKFSITSSGKTTYRLPVVDSCIDDTWTATSDVNPPSGRNGHTAVWTAVK